MVAQIADQVISKHERHHPDWDCKICKVFPALQWQTSVTHERLVKQKVHANKMFCSFKIMFVRLSPHLAEGAYQKIYTNQQYHFHSTLAPCRNVSLLHKLSCCI